MVTVVVPLMDVMDEDDADAIDIVHLDEDNVDDNVVVMMFPPASASAIATGEDRTEPLVVYGAGCATNTIEAGAPGTIEIDTALLGDKTPSARDVKEDDDDGDTHEYAPMYVPTMNET
jgi:hypothetical protein